MKSKVSAITSGISSGNNSSGGSTSKTDKNIRTIDRAAILEEIEQNKIDEIRQNLSNNKNFQRKYSYLGGKTQSTNASA